MNSGGSTVLLCRDRTLQITVHDFDNTAAYSSFRYMDLLSYARVYFGGLECYNGVDWSGCD